METQPNSLNHQIFLSWTTRGKTCNTCNTLYRVLQSETTNKPVCWWRPTHCCLSGSYWFRWQQNTVSQTAQRTWCTLFFSGHLATAGAINSSSMYHKGSHWTCIFFFFGYVMTGCHDLYQEPMLLFVHFLCMWGLHEMDVPISPFFTAQNLCPSFSWLLGK